MPVASLGEASLLSNIAKSRPSLWNLLTAWYAWRISENGHYFCCKGLGCFCRMTQTTTALLHRFVIDIWSYVNSKVFCHARDRVHSWLPLDVKWRPCWVLAVLPNHAELSSQDPRVLVCWKGTRGSASRASLALTFVMLCGKVNSIESASQFLRLSAASKTSLLLRFRDWSSSTFTLKLFCSKFVKVESSHFF